MSKMLFQVIFPHEAIPFRLVAPKDGTAVATNSEMSLPMALEFESPLVRACAAIHTADESRAGASTIRLNVKMGGR
jgi:hypothetical protein